MSPPMMTSLTEGGDVVFVLQKRCSLATRQVRVARTSAGPAVQITRWPVGEKSCYKTVGHFSVKRHARKPGKGEGNPGALIVKL